MDSLQTWTQRNWWYAGRDQKGLQVYNDQSRTIKMCYLMHIKIKATPCYIISRVNKYHYWSSPFYARLNLCKSDFTQKFPLSYILAIPALQTACITFLFSFFNKLPLQIKVCWVQVNVALLLLSSTINIQNMTKHILGNFQHKIWLCKCLQNLTLICAELFFKILIIIPYIS